MIKLEIGKWYKSDLSLDYIIRHSENDTKEGFFEGDYGEWFFDADYTTREAKDYEVIIAFMKEASQRGHKVYNAYFKNGEMYLSDIKDKVVYSKGVWSVLMLLLFTSISFAQDTIYSAKSIGIGHTVTGYMVQKVTKKDTTYTRVINHWELPKSMVKSKLKEYPKQLLLRKESYQSHLRE